MKSTEEWLASYEAREQQEITAERRRTERLKRRENEMLLNDKGGDTAFELAPAGNHVARCVSMIDLGTKEHEWQGKTSVKRTLFISWELPNELRTFERDGAEVSEPFTVSEFYTASLSEKANLRALLESWRGRAFTDQEKAGFDPVVLVGVPCMLNVIHKPKQNGDMKTKITMATPIPKGMTVPEQVNMGKYFSLDEFDPEVFADLSDGLRGMIMDSFEYQKLQGEGKVAQINTPQNQHEPAADDHDDIPF